MRAPSLLVLTMMTATLAGCGGDTPTLQPTGCRLPAIHGLPMTNHDNPVVVWDTTQGCFAAELYQDKAPITAGNFLNLTKKSFYDGTRFHRVIEGFMIQDGDPNSKDPAKKSTWGQGGPGYSIQDEFPCKDGTVSYSHPGDCSGHGGLLYSHNKVGMMSMANSGPRSGGSQYFVVITPSPQRGYPTYLDTGHPIFGRVIWNQVIVENIGKTPTDSGDRPLTDVVNKSLKVVP